MEKKILIIEDVEAEAKLYERYLSKSYSVEIAPNGVKGYLRIMEWSPDLVLLDIILPDGEGYNVLKKLRLGGVPTRVIMMSSFKKSIPDVIQAIREGASDFLEKPILEKTLLERVGTSILSDITLTTTLNSGLVDVLKQCDTLKDKNSALAGLNSRREQRSLWVKAGIGAISMIVCGLAAWFLSFSTGSNSAVTIGGFWLLSCIIFIAWVFRGRYSLRGFKTEIVVDNREGSSD
jgi:CheY-like chemotaxis protein